VNPGYNGFGRHPWENIFVVTEDGDVICGPCLPDYVDPGDQDVEVWAFYTEGWLGPCVCMTCGFSIPVYVNGEQDHGREQEQCSPG
jgi:hypothetical protein